MITMLKAVALTAFLVLWGAAMACNLCEGQTTLPTDPMSRFSTNPTLAEILDIARNLTIMRPDLSEDEILDLAVKRAYDRRRGERI